MRIRTDGGDVGGGAGEAVIVIPFLLSCVSPPDVAVFSADRPFARDFSVRINFFFIYSGLVVAKGRQCDTCVKCLIRD